MAFVYQLSGATGHLFRKSQSLFNDIQSGHIIGVVSTFTISEYLSVIRNAIAKQSGAPPTQQQMMTAETTLRSFLSGMGMELQDADVLIGSSSTRPPVFADTHQIITDSTSVQRFRDHEWTGPGGADAILISLALRMSASRFATFDEGYKGIRVAGITPLMISEEY